MNNIKLEKNTLDSKYLTTTESKEKGITKYELHKLTEAKMYDRVCRGIYISTNELIDDLFILHKRCPKAVFSHDEAFYYHHLTDREPLIHTLTIYTNYNSHRLLESGNCKIYSVKKELLNVGKTIITDYYGNQIPMYNLERTICDLVRNRNSIEIQEFNSVLKSYIARKDKDLNLLMEYAELFHVQNIIRKYMEVLL